MKDGIGLERYATVRNGATEVETLIVGAGPVGLFAATELRRHGRDCEIIERSPGPSSYSKALAIMPRTMEIFDIAGLRDAFGAAVNRIEGVRFVTPRAALFVRFGNLPTEHNYVGILPQWKTEELLAIRLQEFGTHVGYGQTLTSIEQRGAEVCATIESPTGTRRVVARHLLGCDGVRSIVRLQTGIAYEGDSYEEAALLADVPVETAVAPSEARVHVYREGVVTLFPIDTRLRRIVVIAPAQALPENATAAWLQTQIEQAGYRETVVGEPVWSSTFRVHRRIARSMRAGAIFLAGDAAHAHSPVGGQGMNIGLHDAWNLAWKIAYVQAGLAPEELLGTYETERLPVARDVLRRTDFLTHALAHPHALARLGRDVLAPLAARVPFVYQPVVHALSQLDVPYAKRVPNRRLRDGTALYDRLGTSFVRICAHGGRRDTLVRPDGYRASESIRRLFLGEPLEVFCE